MQQQSSATLQRRVEKLRAELESYEQRLKEANERERAEFEEYRAKAAQTIGNALLDAVGAEWTDIDPNDARDWFEAHADEIRELVVSDRLSVAEARRRLSGRRPKARVTKTRQEESDQGTTDDGVQPPADAVTPPDPDPSGDERFFDPMML